MADILHDLPINAPVDRVFESISTPDGLDRWWTLRSSGSAVAGSEYALWFGPEYDWRARVTRSIPNEEFELEFVQSMEDWMGTRVGMRLVPEGPTTHLSFRHTGWRETSAHFRTSSCCWAMYLRILRRHLEHGETVAYERRLEV